MKLIKLKEDPAILGLPKARREWWDIGNGYEVYVSIGKKICNFGIDAPHNKDITLEVAEYLGIDTTLDALKKLGFGTDPKAGELYLSLGIDCVVLNYTKSENYKGLIKRIEYIVNHYIKHEK